jgi:uncharacterized damage-inducible protein DinB
LAKIAGFMTSDTLLKDYTAYNLWANTRIVEWLRAKPLEYMTREIASSFPSLYQTLLHIWGAEEVWIERLQGDSPKQFRTDYFQGPVEEVFAGLLACSEQFRDLIASQSAAYFESQATYTHINGKIYTQNRAQMLLHCMQHSTFHRGQIVTMARGLGLTDPPATDYIQYVRLQTTTSG